jgi:hypothetical protein
MIKATIFCLQSQATSPHYLSSPTNSYPHSSDLKYQSAALSLLCVMFQLQLLFVLDLLNVSVYFICVLVVFLLNS